LGGLSLAIHVWLIRHTEVTARDSIGFIRYAWELEHQPWSEVLRHSHQHPGYPIVLLGVSKLVRQYAVGSEAHVFQLSAQLASAWAGVLTVIPMYFLGKWLFGRGTGFWAAVLFQCLPLSSRMMADGLSEATFLLFVATALLFGVWALQSGSWIGYALCGLFGAVAYMTRPEGALIVAAMALVLLGLQVYQSRRLPWTAFLGRFAALGVGFLILATPYCVTIHGLTTKPTPQIMLSASRREGPNPSASLESQREVRSARAAMFSVFAPDTPYNANWWAAKALATELARAFQYFAAIPAVLGVWFFRHRWRRSPEYWLIGIFCILQILVLWRLAYVMGYLSERHIVVLLLCGVFPAAAAVPVIAHWITQVAARWRPAGLLGRDPDHSMRWLTACLSAALTLSSLPETLKPLHTSRSGHRPAGLWLAQHAANYDPVTDPFCWAHYYAGKVFEEGKTPEVPPGQTPTRYVVMDATDREHGRLPLFPEAKQLAAQGQVVYHWPENRPVENAKILVYAVPMPLEGARTPGSLH
jgi:hypothetical protein